MTKIKIVHVDDSKDVLKTVASLLSTNPKVELVKQFNDAQAAADYIQNHEVHLAILDIEMPLHDGFWLADQIKATKTLIVFLTSHGEHTLKAFDACAIHYLLKPPTEQSINEVVERSRKFINQYQKNESHQSEQINELFSNYFTKDNYPRRIFIDNIHKTSVINLDDLLYLSSSGAYTVFKTISGEQFTASKLLKTYELTLRNHPDFVRIQRGYIINKKYVKGIVRDKFLHSVEMMDGELLSISPRLKEEIYDLIGKG